MSRIHFSIYAFHGNIWDTYLKPLKMDKFDKNSVFASKGSMDFQRLTWIFPMKQVLWKAG